MPATQWLHASGYLSVFLVPILLVAGIAGGEPILAFAVVMLIFPLARVIFGDYPAAPILWREGVATVLDRLPVAFGGVLFIATFMVLQQIRAGATSSSADAVGVGLSLWITMVLATCPAHDLLHRRSSRDRRVGRWIAGLAGYPILGHEHGRHHATSGDCEAAEWPYVHESIWHFARRRILGALSNVIALSRSQGIRVALAGPARELAEACAVTLTALLAFTFAGGLAGFLIYVGLIVGVAFAVQVITYLQHWGLGTDNVEDAADGRYAWEDDCRFQAWVTLHISFHQAHHHSAAVPFYRLQPAPHSPRQPASYVVLMVLCLFPALWRRLMGPALLHWQQHPTEPLHPGHRITCFSAFGTAVDGQRR